MAYERRGPNPLLSPPLTFPEVNQVPILCWVDSESFPVIRPERDSRDSSDSNLRPSAPQPSALTTRPRRLSVDMSAQLWYMGQFIIIYFIYVYRISHAVFLLRYSLLRFTRVHVPSQEYLPNSFQRRLKTCYV